MLAQAQHSKKLIQCLAKLEVPALKSEAKIELLTITNDLMPKGKPDLLGVVRFPQIQELVKSEGKKTMLKVIFLLVKDFCGSMNFVRNMNEDQMIEAASMLLEESGNFRVEDYVMMFSMAKKGQFSDVKMYDRMDIQIIAQILDAYWLARNNAGNKAYEEEYQATEILAIDNPVNRLNLTWDDQKGYVQTKTDAEKLNGFAGAFGELINKMKGFSGVSVEEAKKQIEVNTNFYDPFKKDD